MEREPYSSNEDSTSRRIPDQNTEKLGTGNKGNGESTEKDEEAVQQEKAESSRTKSRRQRVAGKQKHPFKFTFKEVG